MTTDRGTLAALLATMTMLASASPVLAQTEQTAPVRGLEGLANGSPQTNTIPVPDAPQIVLPSETPAPRRSSRPRTAESTTAERPAAGKTPAGKAPAGKTPAGKTPTGKTATERPVAERSTTRNESATRPTPTSAQTSTPASSPTAPTPSPASADRTPLPTPVSEPATSPPPSEAPSTDAVSATPPSAPVTAAAPVTTTPSTVTAPETGRAMPLWLSLAVIVVVLGALWALRRKPRGRRSDRADIETVVEPTPEPFASEPTSTTAVAAPRPVEPVAAPVVPAAAAAVPATPAIAAAPKFLEPRAKTPPPPPAVPRARVTCDLRPLRAGLNLLSATVECELVVTNTGNAPAEAIRTGVALLTAHAGQDTDLARFNAAPVGRPVAAPFALAPGETRTIRTVAAIARDAIQTMTAANRPMFVPVVATNILYATAGDEAQSARAWSIGIERVDSAKLAPFWLDAPARMYTTVAARPHAATFDR